MKLHFPTLPQSGVERRLAALRKYQDEAVMAAKDEFDRRANMIRDALDTPEGVAARAVADLSVAAAVGERKYMSKITGEAVSDLFEAAQQAKQEDAAPVVKLIAKAPIKPAKRPCYMVTTETGEMLVPATTHPLADGAAVLLTSHGLPEGTRIALYHEGKAYPAYGPMKLGAAASCGIQRQRRYAKRAA